MRTKLALLAAVVLGFLAAIGVRHYVEKTKRELEGTARRVAIAVTSEVINRGDPLREHMIKAVEVEAVAVGAMNILYDQRKPWIGVPLARKVKAGEPLMKNDFLGAPDVEQTASRDIQSGWRAITIGVDQISGVGGLITPGCHVDILGTFRERAGGPNVADTVVTRVVARNVEILAVDNRTQLTFPTRAGGRGPQMDRGYSSITVHVTPLEGSLLTFAQGAGKLSCALRRTEDVQVREDVPEITEGRLIEIISAAARERKQLIQQPKTPTPR